MTASAPRPPGDLHALPPGALPALRLVLAVSLDGRLAPPQGGAAQLGGAGDRQVLEEALAWADGCLLGAATLRAHGTTCLIHRPELLAQRLEQHRPPQPAALVVSRQGQLDPHLPFFRQPLQRWLLHAAPADSPPGVLPPGGAIPPQTPPAAFAHRLQLQRWPDTLAALAAAGLSRLLLLGGAQLAAQLLAADLVTELQLTLVPRLLGGRHTWWPVDGPWPRPEAPAWELLEHRSLGAGELMLRYRRSS